MATTVGKFTVKIIRKGEELAFSQSDIIELNIVEDIFSWCMAGNIQFYDKSGYTELLEMVGFDPVIVIFEEEGIQKEKMFIVYDYHRVIEEIQLAPGMNKTIWYFVEPLFMALHNKKYSKAWASDMKISDVIEEIGKNMLGVDKYIEWEDTNEKIDNFYIPYWTPAEAIKWLKDRASGSKSMVPGYLFYSNSEGINFTTLETLVNKSEREKDADGRKVSYIFTGGEDSFNKILDWYIDPPELSSLKYLTGTVRHGYNSDGKHLLKKKYTYEDSINKYSILGTSTLFPNLGKVEDEESNLTNVIIDCENNQDFLDNLAYGDFIRRYSKQFAVGLIVRGHSRRYAGMIIDILWKSMDPSRNTHKMYEGLYLVRSITHQFTTGTNTTPAYRQLMLCVKTGYSASESGQLLKAKKPILDAQITK